jgi:hypothetical protein
MKNAKGTDLEAQLCGGKMTGSRRWITIAIAVPLTVAGCQRPTESDRAGSQPTPSVAPPPTSGPVTSISGAELDALIAKQGSATFRSWNGKWIGMDGDTDLTFLPGGAVHMFEYGDGVASYAGTYAIDPNGNVTVQLPTFGHEWPAMSLGKDSTSMLLVPKEGGGFVMGNRGGAILSGQGTYWPFRPLTAAEEAQVRQRMEKDADGS